MKIFNRQTIKKFLKNPCQLLLITMIFGVTLIVSPSCVPVSRLEMSEDRSPTATTPTVDNSINQNNSDSITSLFWDAPVEGLTVLLKESGKTVVTGKRGEFSCKQGTEVVFKVGKVVLGSTRCAAIITPIDLIVKDKNSMANDEYTPLEKYNELTSAEQQAVVNIARLLHTVMSNDISTNVMVISTTSEELLTYGFTEALGNSWDEEVDFENQVTIDSALEAIKNKLSAPISKYEISYETAAEHLEANLAFLSNKDTIIALSVFEFFETFSSYNITGTASNLPLCNESDWSYTEGECQTESNGNSFIQGVWRKISACSGDVEYPSIIQIPCTATAIPTSTPIPTAIPTSTPIPTAIPTSTPIPTAIPTSTPIPTAIPTSTPIPTATPTSTPIPTAIPTSTPIPTTTPIPHTVSVAANFRQAIYDYFLSDQYRDRIILDYSSSGASSCTISGTITPFVIDTKATKGAYTVIYVYDVGTYSAKVTCKAADGSSSTATASFELKACTPKKLYSADYGTMCSSVSGVERIQPATCNASGSAIVYGSCTLVCEQGYRLNSSGVCVEMKGLNCTEIKGKWPGILADDYLYLSVLGWSGYPVLKGYRYRKCEMVAPATSVDSTDITTEATCSPRVHGMYNTTKNKWCVKVNNSTSNYTTPTRVGARIEYNQYKALCFEQEQSNPDYQYLLSTGPYNKNAYAITWPGEWGTNSKGLTTYSGIAYASEAPTAYANCPGKYSYYDISTKNWKVETCSDSTCSYQQTVQCYMNPNLCGGKTTGTTTITSHRQCITAVACHYARYNWRDVYSEDTSRP